MTRKRARAALLLVISLGAILRWQGLRWDSGHHLHPDERFISMVEERLEYPSSLGEYFDSKRSPLNPYNRGHSSFVYGTLPIVLAKVCGGLLGMKGYDGSYLAGRALSGLFDLLTVWIVYLIARRAGGSRRAALLAAGLLSFCALGIQLSHFWAVDTFLTTFSAATLLGAVRQARGRSGPLGDLATGLALGLAAACKVTALALLLPVGIALLVRGLQADRPRNARTFGVFAAKAAVRFLLVAAAAALAVRFALPHAFAGPGPFSFRLDPRYIEDIKRLADLGRSAASFPPAFQWADRTILFPIRNLVLWGAGPFFGLAGLAGLLWALLASRRAERRPLLPLALYALFLLVYHGTTLAKSVRYFYPAYPVLAVLAGLGLAALGRKRAARALGAILLGGTFLWSLAFTSIYRRPHTRVAATRWIYENIPPPAPIANEAWDDGLPLPLPGYDAAVYAGPTLHLFDPDSRDKVEMVVKALTSAKWIAVTSNRVYANLTRLPDVFPMSSAYYRALFDGRLGFENAAQFSSYPSLGPLRFPDDRAEEQFTVYDHPRVLLFRKTPAFSAERTRQILLASMPKPPPTLGEWEMKPAGERRVVTSLVPRRKAGPLRTAAKAMPEWAPGSFAAAVVWYFALALMGLVALPVCHALFPRFADRGYGLARVLGLLLLTYVYSLAVRTEVVRNGGATAWAILALFALAAAVVLWRKRHPVTAFLRENRRALLAGEALFFLGFALFLGIRAFNPEIAWGEKPMDFSILNILVRTRTLPPSDPWFAGAPLSYYFFGHQMISFLTLLTGLSTRYTFNLAFGFLGGATLQGAFSVARNWAGTSRAGAAAAAFTLLIGNLSGLRLWFTPAAGPGGATRAHDWHYFWATSRVIPDTINEYPFWSLLFADLHAHVLAMPLFLLFVACALRFVRDHAAMLTWRHRLTAAALLGFAAAAQVLTNAWDVPLLSGLLLVVALVSAWGGGRVSAGSLARAAIGLAVSVGVALLAAAPLWVRAGGVPGVGWNQEIVREADLLTAFGFFFLLALAWWASRFSAELSDRGTSRPARAAAIALLGVLLLALALRSASAFCAVAVLLFLVAAARAKDSPGERLAAAFVASAFFLVLFALHAYIYDRMNTFFKLHFAAWLLFAVATAVLVFGTGRGSLPRRAIASRAVLVLLLAATLFTSVTAARGALFMPGNPSRRGPSTGPTLDGLAYLERFRPGEFYAAQWLRRQVPGTPVLLEAQGPSYQDFGRISMLTGLPTVLGWDYHVKQRGNPESEIEERRGAVSRIYSSPEAEPVEGLLRKYHVGYVYAGWLERQTYPPSGLKKFETAQGLFELAYENREARIYRVIGGDTEDVVKPAREFLPAPAAAAGPPQEEPEEPPSLSETAAPEMGPYAGMREPRDADVDSRGRLWIADFGNSRIRVFDRDGGFLGGWGGRGAGTHGLREPGAVAIREEDLYIADTWNGRIQGFGLDGTWKAKADGLYGPRGVAVSPDGRVWAADTGNHRLAVYRPDLTEPQFIGKNGSAPGEFQGPVGIAVSSAGQVFVADTGNKRIQIFGPDGVFQAAWKFPGWVSPGEPHLAIDSGGNVYATDPEAGKLLVLDPAGRVVRTLTANQAGEKFSKPTGLALDRKARVLYVINSGNNTVSKLELPEGRP